MKIKSMYLFMFVLALALVAAGCSGDSPSEDSSEPASAEESESAGNGEESAQSGGTLNIAYEAQPNTLDPTVTTAGATKDMARQIYEALLTLNENWEVTPQLAESYEVSENGKIYIFKLRQGIKFHNGDEMTADDVVASMEKWTDNSSLTQSILNGAEWKKVDDYTVELHLEKPSALVPFSLADQNQLAAIMPQEVAESAGPIGATEYIGTGPFKFVEWKQDQYIHFTRFEDYQPVSEPASGLAGEKLALVDDVYWHIVPDESTRNAGLISGQYDVVVGVSYDAIEQIENTQGLSVDIYPYGFQMLVFNKKQGLFSDVKARQAVNYALDKEMVLRSSFGDERFYTLEPSLFRPEQTDWYSDAGKELYNPKDLDKAKQLLEETGYNGEEIIILTSRDYAYQYNAAVATQQLLQEIGINAKLDVYDWGTLLELRSAPEVWDIFFTGWDTSVIPHQYGFLDSKAEWPGWTNSPKIDGLLSDIESAESQEEAKALYAQLQQELWEYLPIINVGTYSKINGISEKVKGFRDFIGPVVWNVSVEE
ncbi:peptide/nickel transport system substrate-binding protein [Caldalkalibacillus uzonensis]|uniref:Peptide/nickel transport system substrate-binding protein n=1 Tax=Caldalkalibacillus uzonensis TaxID=353224 RepID=A0ABU0CXW3_9BACI|nr:ABC transporter substrate-binding protein [Caldalkalibacillus uzonensis]MDQ0340984.1 peptide/nickel transport system substrate-binding protein [Caldalkalibacillus uzonensis]